MSTDFPHLEWRIRIAERVLIGVSILSIAVADYAIGPELTLGPLYLIPLSFAALTCSWRTVAGLLLVCLGLRQWLGPLGVSGDPWLVFFRDLAIAAVFLAIVWYLLRLSVRRREFFELARRQRDDLAAEVDLAASVQERLLELRYEPDERLDVFAGTRPLKGVGGDYHDLVRLGPDRTAVVVADVAGKGLAAALLMPAVRIAVRSILDKSRDPAVVVTELNRMLWEATDVRSHATLFFAIVDLEQQMLAYVNAGHVPGLLRDRDGVLRELMPSGPPVGLLQRSSYDTMRSPFVEGSVLVLATDGVTEARDRTGEELGLERWRELVREARGETADDVAGWLRRSLREFRGHDEFDDDVTVLVLRRSAKIIPEVPPTD